MLKTIFDFWCQHIETSINQCDSNSCGFLLTNVNDEFQNVVFVFNK